MLKDRSLRCQSYPIAAAGHGEILPSNQTHVVYVPMDRREPEPPQVVYVESRHPEPPRRGPSNTSIVLLMAIFFTIGAMFGSLLESRSAKKNTVAPPEAAAVPNQRGRR